MDNIALIVHTVIAIAIVALVLLQQGKGTGMGASFGGGSSNTVFGSRGPASFFFKLTAFLSIGFVVTSLGLAILAGNKHNKSIDVDALTLDRLQEQAAAQISDPDALPEVPTVLSQKQLDQTLQQFGVEQLATGVGFVSAITIDGITQSLDSAALDMLRQFATLLGQYPQQVVAIRASGDNAQALLTKIDAALRDNNIPALAVRISQVKQTQHNAVEFAIQ